MDIEERELLKELMASIDALNANLIIVNNNIKDNSEIAIKVSSVSHELKNLLENKLR